MKKFIYLIILGIQVCSCKQPKTSTVVAGASTHSSTETLNGFTQADAVKMTKEFWDNASKYNKPTNTQVLINEPEFKSMLDLLNDECKNKVIVPDGSGGTKKVVPDGIRIYFANDIGTGARSSANNIIIVSTYEGPKYVASNGVTAYSHIDYFNHAKVSGLTGKIAHEKDGTNGATLFNSCDDCSKIGCPNFPADWDHAVSEYDGVQMVTRFKSQTINSRAVWFKLPQLNSFYDQLTTYNEDGVRIYFARHYKKGDPYIGLCSFVIVPTKNGIDKYDCDTESKSFSFSPWTDGTDNGELCPVYCNGASLATN